MLSGLIAWLSNPLLIPVGLLAAYPAYTLLMAGALRLLGNSKSDVASWAMKRAGRQSLADLIGAARGLPPPRSAEPPVTDERSVDAQEPR